MSRFLGFYDYTVILTYASLLAAVSSMFYASQGNFFYAVFFLMLSGLCDAFDGAVARSKKDRTEEGKAFGIQIDSLCDAVSFGLFPAIWAYFYGLKGPVGMVIVAVFSLCAIIRLGFFNVLEGKRQQTEGGCNKFYRGMPVTTISMLLPAEIFVIVLHVVMAAAAFLFVLDFRVKKIQLTALFKR